MQQNSLIVVLGKLDNKFRSNYHHLQKAITNAEKKTYTSVLEHSFELSFTQIEFPRKLFSKCEIKKYKRSLFFRAFREADLLCFMIVMLMIVVSGNAATFLQQT